MSPIRVRTKIESETLHLPELKAVVGKEVEIQITERAETDADDRWEEIAEAAAGLSDYDFDAWAEHRC